MFIIFRENYNFCLFPIVEKTSIKIIREVEIQIKTHVKMNVIATQNTFPNDEKINLISIDLKNLIKTAFAKK